MIHTSFYVLMKYRHGDNVIFSSQHVFLIHTDLNPPHFIQNIFFLCSSLAVPLICSSTSLQCLCLALRDSPSWDTTTAPCPRRILALHVWSGLSFQTMSCSTRAVAWATTATAGTRTESPTPGASSGRTQALSAGLTVTATKVRQHAFRSDYTRHELSQKLLW